MKFGGGGGAIITRFVGFVGVTRRLIIAELIPIRHLSRRFWQSSSRTVRSVDCGRRRRRLHELRVFLITHQRADALPPPSVRLGGN